MRGHSDFIQTDCNQNYIMLENMWIQTIKKVVFAKKAPIGTRMPCYKKVSRVVLLVPLQGMQCFSAFLCMQMKQHDLDFPTRENNYIIILFIRSGLNSCRKVTFIVSVISTEISWIKNAVNLYFWKKWGATTMESGPQYIYIWQSFVFSRENSKLSSVLSVLSCYITCIAHTFHINGI